MTSRKVHPRDIWDSLDEGKDAVILYFVIQTISNEGRNLNLGQDINDIPCFQGSIDAELGWSDPTCRTRQYIRRNWNDEAHIELYTVGSSAIAPNDAFNTFGKGTI